MARHIRFFIFVLPLVAPIELLEAGTPTSVSEITYEDDIRPILKTHCFGCHGETGNKKGNLDLRLRRLIVNGGDSGPAITPGNPDKSYLLRRITSGEMPPGENRVPDESIERIRTWIAEGAPTSEKEPENLSEDDLGVSATDRQYWAFLPIIQQEIPEYSPEDRVRTPIDALLLKSMRSKGLHFSKDADRITLLRRVFFDLTGLPPTPDDVEQFMADTGEDAYERLIDRLMASPHYGERWGRHWLDIAGYADSEGYNNSDTQRKYAYRYRDYVIRSFNADKPFDSFIIEQLAGDELIQPPYTNLDQGKIEKLVATGFLRMGADGTSGGNDNADVARNQVIADAIKILSTSLLGLSVGCAQCHDHRYDPIPQKDYYRLRALLEPVYDWKKWRTPQDRRISLYTDADRAKAAEVESEASVVAEEKSVKQKDYIAQALEKELEKFDISLRDTLRLAFQTPADKRTDEQKKLLDANPSVKITPGVLYQYNQKAADDLKTYDKKLSEIRARKPTEEFLRVATEIPGSTPVTYVFHRGDHRQPKDAVAPGGLTIAAPPGKRFASTKSTDAIQTSGRRLGYARWLTSGKHPLVARVLVNRFWMHHFGRAIASTPGEFGNLGEAPSHPELLDWLARDFMIHGWKLKRLHKLIMTSTVYRQASLRTETMNAIDPFNVHYWKMPVRRLDAEAIRDSILRVSGVLNIQMFGAPIPVREDSVGQIVVGVDKKSDIGIPVDGPSLGQDQYRRSVYIEVRRSRPLGLLRTFDAPVMEVNCAQRTSSTVSSQALLLMNSGFILELSRLFAHRVMRQKRGDRHAQVQLAWKLAYARSASDLELEQSMAFLNTLDAQLQPAAESKPASDKEDKEKSSPPDSLELQALTSFCQVLLGSNEFLYLD